jgi:DNA-binding Xre family transcriptional regulator
MFLTWEKTISIILDTFNINQKTLAKYLSTTPPTITHLKKGKLNELTCSNEKAYEFLFNPNNKDNPASKISNNEMVLLNLLKKIIEEKGFKETINDIWEEGDYKKFVLQMLYRTRNSASVKEKILIGNKIIQIDSQLQEETPSSGILEGENVVTQYEIISSDLEEVFKEHENAEKVIIIDDNSPTLSEYISPSKKMLAVFHKHTKKLDLSPFFMYKMVLFDETYSFSKKKIEKICEALKCLDYDIRKINENSDDECSTYIIIKEFIEEMLLYFKSVKCKNNYFSTNNTNAHLRRAYEHHENINALLREYKIRET